MLSADQMRHMREDKGIQAKETDDKSLCMCGETTQLHDLKAAYMYCKCGANFKYRTNLTDDKISHECLKCGTQVEMAINYRGTAYITV